MTLIKFSAIALTGMLLACVGFVFATVLTWMGSDIAVIPTTMVGALFGVVIGMVVWASD